MPLLALPYEILLLIGSNLDQSSLSLFARSCRPLYAPLDHLLYQRDARGKAYALYWACFCGNPHTARKSMQAGASSDGKWLVGIDNSRILIGVHDQLGELFEDSEKVVARIPQITPRPVRPSVLHPPAGLALATSKLGRLAYAHALTRGLTKIPPSQRDIFWDSCVQTYGVSYALDRFDFKVFQSLHIAVYRRQKAVVAQLLDDGANASTSSSGICRCEYHMSSLLWMQHAVPALHIAITQGDEDMAKLLMSRGAVLSIRCSPPPMTVPQYISDGLGPSELEVVWSALHDCARTNNSALADTILSINPSELEVIDATHYDSLCVVESALRQENWEFLRFLVSRGVDLDTPRRRGVPLIFTALLTGPDELTPVLGTHKPFTFASNLIDLGADPTVTTGPAHSIVSLQWRLLFNQFAGPWTVLHTAAFMPVEDNPDEEIALKEVVQAVLARGVSPDVQDGLGNTPLHVAAVRGSASFVYLMLELGADPNACNHEHKTPWALLVSNGIGDARLVRQCDRLLLQNGGSSVCRHLQQRPDLLDNIKHRKSYDVA